MVAEGPGSSANILGEFATSISCDVGCTSARDVTFPEAARPSHVSVRGVAT